MVYHWITVSKQVEAGDLHFDLLGRVSAGYDAASSAHRTANVQISSAASGRSTHSTHSGEGEGRGRAYWGRESVGAKSWSGHAEEPSLTLRNVISFCLRTEVTHP